MRLTLRTLLAYLDDTLEPAQARLIGQKVAESDAAQELVARIKQVTRRRRLTVAVTQRTSGLLSVCGGGRRGSCCCHRMSRSGCWCTWPPGWPRSVGSVAFG